MKKLLYLTIFLLSFFAVQTVLAEEIRDFSTEININADASIDVAETITYDFGQVEKHGIYRDIPFKYHNNKGNYNLRFSNIMVTDALGDKISYKVINQGDNKRIKIGEADKTVTGINFYKISYHVRRAINYFDDHDELYWNVTGNEWGVPILQSKAEVVLPTRVGEQYLQSECFSGPDGSNNKCFSERFNYSGANIVDKIVYVDDRLNSHEGLTIVVGVPKGLIIKPAWWQNFLEIIKDNWILGLPLAVWLVLIYLWRARGRDLPGRGTIIAQFGPPDSLTPAQVGTIVDEQVHKKDISADIINLAVKGCIKITRLEKKIFFFGSTDYLIEKIKDESSLKNEHEKKLMSALFENNTSITSFTDLLELFKSYKTADKSGGSEAALKSVYENMVKEKKEASKENTLDVVKLSDLKNKFYKDLEEIKKSLYQEAVKDGYFPVNPSKVRGWYAGVGAVFIFGGIFIGSAFGFLSAISMAVSGIIIIAFSFAMPAKTKKGSLAKEHILGLKEYLKVAEADRIKFHNAPEKNPKHFEELLPFAMVLGVESEWAKQFEGIYNQQPSWYTDPSGGYFTASALSRGLGSFQAKANTTLASRPSSAGSGGSGFSGGGSGGGFGGGGGGSW